jgi:hypothetical protein
LHHLALLPMGKQTPMAFDFGAGIEEIRHSRRLAAREMFWQAKAVIAGSEQPQSCGCGEGGEGGLAHSPGLCRHDRIVVAPNRLATLSPGLGKSWRPLPAHGLWQHLPEDTPGGQTGFRIDRSSHHLFLRRIYYKLVSINVPAQSTEGTDNI